MSIKPVFVKNRDIPHSDSSFPKVLEVCTAAEGSCGKGLIVGAQPIRGLWRIYPASQEARLDLLMKGMTIRDTCLHPSDNNPYILRDDTGEERPSTKLWIDEVPISVADDEIKYTLSKLGCELRTAIFFERARDPDGKLTRFLTGRRYVFITVPKTPLLKSAKVGVFTAKLFHKEQKMNSSPPVCSVCLQTGHHRSACSSEVVCQTCRQSGHRRGDPSCSMEQPDVASKESRTSGADKECQESNSTTSATSTTSKDSSKTPVGTTGNKSPKKLKQPPRPTERSRSITRQKTLSFAVETGKSRERSATPKRRFSGDPECTSESAGKMARHNKHPSNEPMPMDNLNTEEEEHVESVWG